MLAKRAARVNRIIILGLEIGLHQSISSNFLTSIVKWIKQQDEKSVQIQQENDRLLEDNDNSKKRISYLERYPSFMFTDISRVAVHKTVGLVRNVINSPISCDFAACRYLPEKKNK